MKKSSYLILALCAATSSALAAPKCDQETTQGTWVYTCEGTLPTLPAPTQTATRILGRCTTSKSAFWTCEGTVNLGGQIIAQGLRGQAYNNQNCTGRISYVQTLGGLPAGNLDIVYVVSDKGDEINGLPVNTGGVLSCSLKRIGNGSD